jgi:hypothetical protein
MAVIGFTAKLELYDGTSNAYEVVDETTMITLPAQDVTTGETTYLGLATPYKTYTPGLTDSGTLSFECNYTKATYNRLQAVRGKLKHTTVIPPSGTDVNWKVTAPDEDAGGAGTAQTFTMNGILTKLDLGIEIEGVMKIKGEVTISGAITVA